MKDCNCCDGVYNSLDIHFTSACDNKCAHCIDMRFNGVGVNKPNPKAIAYAVLANSEGVDDVLFLGGEPCLYLEELLQCVQDIKQNTTLKVYVTTAMPKVCYDKKELFYRLLSEIDGLNISAQHYREEVADEIRQTKSGYDRQEFYRSLPYKQKIRINLNIVKPYLHTKEDLTDCLRHYDEMGFNSIKLSEIQHGKDVYVSFAELFGLDMKSPYSYGCQTYLDVEKIFGEFTTPILLKRSCFLCEESLKATLSDGVKVIRKLFKTKKNKYGVIYGNGTLTKGWV